VYDVAFNLLSCSLRESALCNESMQENDELYESTLSPASEAALGISRMIKSYPIFFTNEANMGALSGMS
jgi:hypothetical protein